MAKAGFIITLSSAIGCIIYFALNIEAHKSALLLAILLLFLSLIFLLVSLIPKNKKNSVSGKLLGEQNKVLYKRNQLQQTESRENKYVSLLCLHVIGLQLPYEANCKITLNASNFIVEKNKETFFIPKKELMQIEAKSGKAIYKQYISGPGGVDDFTKFQKTGNEIAKGRKELLNDYFIIIKRDVGRRIDYIEFNCGTAYDPVNEMVNFFNQNYVPNKLN